MPRERHDGLSMRLVLEQHVGHRTYAENLIAAARRLPGIDVHEVAVTYGPSAPRWMPDAVGHLWGTLNGIRQVRRGLRWGSADVTVFNTQVPAALAGRRLSPPYVVVTDVTPAQYDLLARGYGHHTERFAVVAERKDRVNRAVFAGASTCVGWSEWVATSLRDDYGVPAERVRVVPPGVDIERWRRPGEHCSGDRVEVLFVGGDFERKGGDLLVQAVSALPDDVHLTVVTKADVQPGERVTVVRDLGPNDPRLIALFHTADVFALPSRAETFGIAAIEASAAGLPLVVSDSGALGEIAVDGVTGCVVPAGDGRALRTALESLVTDPTLRVRLGTAAHARASARFDATVNADLLLGIAREAADKKRAA